MRILILIHEFPPVGGGGGQAAYAIARELIGRGHEITIITALLKGLPREDILDGIHILRLPSMRKQATRVGFLSMGIYILASLIAGYRLIRRWHPDLVHVHFAVPAGVTGWILSRLSRVPYVLTAHLGDVPGGVPEKTGKWFRWVFPFTKPIWRDAGRITTVCEYTSLLAFHHYGARSVVIPNGIDLKAIYTGDLKVNHPPVVVFAGRFTTQKNLIELINILALVGDLPWKCIMLGDGPLLNEVKLAISAHGLEHRFSLPGWVSPEEVLTYFSHCDLLFMPSLSEGLPVVGVQALAKGLAIVANRVGGFIDLVEQGRNGYLADLGDINALVVALRNLLSNQDALLSARLASRDIARRFDIKIVVDAYENIFREVVP